MNDSKEFNLYKDIQIRTGGEIYIGVVGPVRTGKSTFIKRFMDLLVLPNIVDIHSRERAVDELPQSAAGKTIMTTEPKFIPKEAVKIHVADDIEMEIRLIDCVGYMVNGASGHVEDDKERMVKTPWYDYEIPFTKAAEIGTRKVIAEHSTIGIVVTTDGSFGELERENYIISEEKTIQELKELGKPFVVLLNTNRPYTEETLLLCDEMRERYQVGIIPVNCQQLKKEDITLILSQILDAFPISELQFFQPKWVEMLSNEHWLKENLLEEIRRNLPGLTCIRNIRGRELQANGPYIKQFKTEKIDLQTGEIMIQTIYENSYYYDIMSEFIGQEVKSEYQLISLIRSLVSQREEYEKVSGAWNEVHQKGYSVVIPDKKEIRMETPELMKHGNKYGVKIKAMAPSVHMIYAMIETEVAPLVGSSQQAEDLMEYIQKNSVNNEEGIWETNIFGKSISQLVEEGVQAKVSRLSEEGRVKLQESMEKIVNENNGGLVCFII